MWPLHLLVALSGLAMTVVLGQSLEQNLADPPPLPEKGMFLLLSIYMSNLALTLFGVIFP